MLNLTPTGSKDIMKNGEEILIIRKIVGALICKFFSNPKSSHIGVKSSPEKRVSRCVWGLRARNQIKFMIEIDKWENTEQFLNIIQSPIRIKKEIFPSIADQSMKMIRWRVIWRKF